jgi:hypothetical protein
MSEPSRAQRFAERLAALGNDPDLCRKAAARELVAWDPTDATSLLHELIALSRAGSENAHCALMAISSALTREAREIPDAATLKRLAELQDLEDVALLFADDAPKQVFDAATAAKKDAQKFTETLGHLKSKARLTTNRDELTRIVTSQDPTVVQNALINPRMTEELVIRMAARRPSRPEPLMEIWKSGRWALRPAVRRALVFNPYFPPEVAAKIVPLLGHKDLQEVQRDGSLPETVRKLAHEILTLPRSGPPEGPEPQGDA